MAEITDDIIQYQIAARAISAFGNIPGSFSLAIYLLLKNPSIGPMPREGAAAFQASRLLCVPRVKAASQSASNLYGFEWEEGEDLPEFDALSMAGILFSIYLHNRVSRMCDKSEWDFVTPIYFRDILASGIVMKSIYKSGLGIALISTTAIYSALGSICALDKKGFKEYRRRRKSERFFLNHNLEMELFGCSSLVIARELVQRFRFGTKMVESFFYGFDLSISETVLPPGARPFRSLAKLLAAIHDHAKPNVGLESNVLGLNPDTAQALNNILMAEQKTSWLNGESQ